MNFIVVVASLFTWIDFSFIDETSIINSEHREKMSIRRSNKKNIYIWFVVVIFRIARTRDQQSKYKENKKMMQ